MLLSFKYMPVHVQNTEVSNNTRDNRKCKNSLLKFTIFFPGLDFCHGFLDKWSEDQIPKYHMSVPSVQNQPVNNAGS